MNLRHIFFLLQFLVTKKKWNKKMYNGSEKYLSFHSKLFMLFNTFANQVRIKSIEKCFQWKKTYGKKLHRKSFEIFSLLGILCKNTSEEREIFTSVNLSDDFRKRLHSILFRRKENFVRSQCWYSRIPDFLSRPIVRRVVHRFSMID